MGAYKKEDKFIITVSDVQAFEDGQSAYGLENSSLVLSESVLNDFKHIDSTSVQIIQDEAYQQGMNDAWALAKRLFMTPYEYIENALSDSDLNEIFETRDVAYIVNRYTLSEIKSKIEAWEKSKQEIKVGDVVKCSENELVITSIRGKDSYYCLNKYGQFVVGYRENLTKTGRTIDIASVLEQIGETV